MALRETIKHLHDLLAKISKDLAKAERGNKAASQRVRTGTIRLAKVAKVYRKESISAGRGAKKKKAPAKKKGRRR